METPTRKNGRRIQKGSKGNAKSGKRDSISLLAELKANKIEYYKDGDFEVKFSPLAFLPDIVTPPEKTENIDELMYYSTQGRP
jgi:hypothetical protein